MLCMILSLNYMVKMMLLSMKCTIQHPSLSGENNQYARKIYEDMT